MEKYEIELYEKVDGTCPVAEFLDELEPKMWAKVTRNIDVLAEHNLNLREPLVKPIENGIFELRTQSGGNIARVFYFLSAAVFRTARSSKPLRPAALPADVFPRALSIPKSTMTTSQPSAA